jgi:hypothetical protein
MTNNGRACWRWVSLNLTAETSRWAHAARTWPEAWHGVLHDSEQDFGDGGDARGVGGGLSCDTTPLENSGIGELLVLEDC